MRGRGESAIGAGSSPIARVWKLSRIRPRLRMVGLLDDPPGMAEGIDVAAPGERLVADAHAAPRRPLGQRVEIGGGARIVVDRVGRRHSSTPASGRAELLHDVELALGAVEIARQASRGAPSKSRNGWNSTMSQAEVGRHVAHHRRRAVEIQQVVLEDLDAVEPRRRGRRRASPPGVPLSETVAMAWRIGVLPDRNIGDFANQSIDSD